MRDLMLQVLSELRSAWRFRWHAVMAAWSVALVGLGVVAWLPNVYEATARVYVDGTSVLRPLLNERIVAPDVATHLLYVRQALLGREYLERVATGNGLFGAVPTVAARERVLADLATDIQIDNVPDGTNRDSASSVYTISYRNQRRDVAIGVVDSLLNSLIEDTLGANREGTDMAARFLDERIAEHESRLQKAEQALAEFQRANSGTLPGTEGTYFERMQRERDQLEQTRRDLRLAESKRDRLRQQATSESPLVLEDGVTREPPANSIDARIRDQRAQLDRLLLRYTESHPEVIALRESVTRLEAQRAEQLRSLGIADGDQQLSALGSNPVYQAVQIALNEADVDIVTLEADVRDRRARLDELQALINEVPAVEAELARLNRDYNVIKDQHQALIQSRERQQLSEQASASDQPDFRVLNPPAAEFGPVAPRRLLLLAGVLVAALAAGGGLSYLLSQLRPVFSSGRTLREVTGFPVIGSVSRAALDPRLVTRRRHAVGVFSLAIAGLVLTVGGAALYEVAGPGIHSLLGGA